MNYDGDRVRFVDFASAPPGWRAIYLDADGNRVAVRSVAGWLSYVFTKLPGAEGQSRWVVPAVVDDRGHVVAPADDDDSGGLDLWRVVGPDDELTPEMVGKGMLQRRERTARGAK